MEDEDEDTFAAMAQPLKNSLGVLLSSSGAALHCLAITGIVRMLPSKLTDTLQLCPLLQVCVQSPLLVPAATPLQPPSLSSVHVQQSQSDCACTNLAICSPLSIHRETHTSSSWTAHRSCIWRQTTTGIWRPCTKSC